MDHEEMKNAYIRAKFQENTDMFDFCNDCKLPYDSDTGHIVHVQSVLNSSNNKVYRIWYCTLCYQKLSQQNGNFSFF